MEIGAQLFTLREHCKTPEDFAETLKRVADIGYRTVQVSGTCAYDPPWLREQLQKTGLRCVVTHIAPDRLISDPQKVADEHTAFGCGYVGLGYWAFKDDMESITRFVDTFRPVTSVIKANKKLFMYHNHATEFQKIGNKTVLELISERFPADELGVTLDTYWVQVGGGDPAGWLERLSGRVPCIHLKDCAYGQKMAVLGEGNINFDRVFQQAEAAGTRYMLVEQDDCNGEDPFDCLARSYAYLKARGFA